MPADITTAVSGGLIAGSVTMLGWFVTDLQRRKESKRNRRAEYIHRQISELYAPLSLLANKEYVYRELQNELIDKGDKDASIYTKEFVVPTQLEIYNLIQSKAHLLGHGEKLSSFQAAQAHCSRALSLYKLAHKVSRNFPHISAERMPDEFKDDVKHVLEELQSEYDKLLRV